MPLQQIVTPEWLKATYLYGIDLTNDRNEEYPDELWIHSIDSAIAMAEAQFDVVMRANRRAKQVERHDAVDWSKESWNLITTRVRPIVRVNRVGIRYGEREANDLPLPWVVISSAKAGQIQLVPAAESFAGFSYVLGGVSGFELVNYRYMPAWFEVEYEAGWETRLSGSATIVSGSPNVVLANGVDDDSAVSTPEAASELKVGNWLVFDDYPDEVYRVKTITSDTEFSLWTPSSNNITAGSVTVLDYDPLLVDFVGLMASLLPLDTAGDLIIGAGISSQSLSMDGLSQSISTTSGVENSGYGARAVQYGKRLKEITKQLTRHYRPISIAVW
jgi:hypothetical protein